MARRYSTKEIKMEKDKAKYIGDGVYATFDGYQVEVYTFNGIEITQHIYFNDETAEELVAFFIKCFGQ
jgi:hypothetical protein